MTSQFGNGSWKPDGSIWGSTGRNHIGSAFSGDLPSSRASDEASPTTVSGSAQLNHQSEAETPSWRNGIWNQEGSSQVHPSSGTASPSQTRSAVGQSSAFAGRPKNTNAFINGFGSTNDSLDNGPTFPPLGSRMFDGTSAYKRGSLGEFPVISQARKNSVPGQRSHDFSSQTTPGSLNHDLAQYPFEGVSRSSVSRPSVPHQSISFPTNGSLDQELSHLLSDSIRLNDNSPGNPNPTTQPFRFDPSSQAWNNGFAVNGRHFSQIYPQQDPYRDQTPAAYSQQAQGASLERASPSSHSFSRNGLSSPRYTPGTGPRQDSWSQSRPISRGPSMPQEYERQPTAQFSQPASGYYSGAPYYGNNNFSTQYSMPLQAYDIYGPNAGYRGQLAAAQFSMINQGASNSVRPNKDQDPGKGVRSVLLEEFRASNRSNKRWELKDIFGHVVEFSGDQHGSRFIQEKLQSANSDEKDQVFHEIKSNALQLMKDVFGNYVIQKFFEHGSQVQKTILAREMKGRVLELSVQMYACRVVQKVSTATLSFCTRPRLTRH